MSNQTQTQASRWRFFAGGVVLLFSFAILAALAIAIGGGDDPIERKEMGEFTEEVTKQRWANREEVSKTQAELVDEEKVAASIKKVISEAKGSKAAKTEFLVPGSPTFLKQAQQQAPAEGSDAETPAEGGEEGKSGAESDAKPAEGGEGKAKAEETPSEPAESETPKASGETEGGKGAKGGKKANPGKGKGGGKGKEKA